MMSWNLRSKSLLALQNAWDVLDAQGVDFLFLQELGGEGEACAPWDKITLNLGRQEFTAFVGNPPAGFRAQAVCLSDDLVPFVERVELLNAGLLVVVKRQGARIFLVSLHLPHAQREDCIQVWENTLSDLDTQLACLRYHDAVCIGADLNLEVFKDTSQDERRVYLEDMVINHALSISHPAEPTWYNSRGSSSAIDYLLYRAPSYCLGRKRCLRLITNRSGGVWLPCSLVDM